MILKGRFFAVLAGGLFITAMGFWDERALQVVIPYYGVVFAFAFLTYFLTPRASQIEVDRRYDLVMSVRVPNVVILRVRNAGSRPIRFHLREELPSQFRMEKREFFFDLQPGEQKEVRYHVTPGERGDFYFRNSMVRVEAPLGLVARQEVLPTAMVVRVFPNVLALREFELLKQRGHLKEMGIRQSRLKGVGTDFESLREYTIGDDYRRIEWKVTARRGKIIVKEMEAERNQPVILVVDYGRLMMAEIDGVQKLDYVLDASLLLGNAVVGAHDLLGLLLFADHVERWLPPSKGRKQLGMVIEALHALRAQPIEPNSPGAFNYLARHWKRRSLIVVFTELEDEGSARELVTVLGPLIRRHLSLVVTVADPRLKGLRKAPIDSEEGMFLRTSALLIDQQRWRARAILEQRGINVLNAEPEELGPKLVNYYMRIKVSASL